MVDLRISLRELSLGGVECRGGEIGRGAYGVVKEYTYNGLRCAGKEIHVNLADADSESSAAMAERFEQECVLLSKQHHPNIVLFMGVFFKQDTLLPVLIMEQLPMSLDGALTKYPHIPPYMKHVILYDIACGLSFLHGQNPPLIHRDLSSRNVLLTEYFRAKIADLGVSRVVQELRDSSQLKLTKIPGTPVFMPPESFMDNPEYDESLDMFSYGNLILNVINQKWPQPTDRVTKDKKVALELDRRQGDLAEMGETHPLRKLAERCLSEEGKDRPKAIQAVEELFELKEANQSPFYSDALQMIQQITALSDEVKQREGTVAALKEENGELKQKNASVNTDNKTLEMRVADLTRDVSSKESEVKLLTDLKRMNENTIHAKENLIDAINNQNAALKSTSKISLLGPTTALKWEECSSLPHPRKHLQAVEFKDKIYIGSGYSTTDDVSRLVYCYIPATDKWEESLVSNTQCFAMTVFNDTVLLIGGILQDKKFCKQVQLLTHDEKKFMFYKSEDMPEMNVARAGAISFSLTFNIIVVGGYENKDRLSSVEVYDRRFKTWYKGPELPCLCAELKAAVAHGDQCYVMGGSNQYGSIFTASLTEIAEKSVKALMGERRTQSDAGSRNEDDCEVWSTLAKAPYDFSFVSVFGGSLVMLGGEKSKFRATYYSQISAYSNSKQAWFHIADLPVGLSKAMALTLRCGDMLVIGGRSQSDAQVDTMHRCKLVCSKSCTEEQ